MERLRGRLFPDKERIKQVVRENLEKEIDIGILISTNMTQYKTAFKENRFSDVMGCKIIHMSYIFLAKRKGVDISLYPKKLNDLDELN